MKFKKYKVNPMNEAFIGSRMLPKKPVEDVVAAVPIAYADAINQHKEMEKKLENDFKEKTKEADDFLKVNHDKEQKPKSTPDMKKMHLSEDVLLEKDKAAINNAKREYESQISNVTDGKSIYDIAFALVGQLRKSIQEFAYHNKEHENNDMEYTSSRGNLEAKSKQIIQWYNELVKLFKKPSSFRYVSMPMIRVATKILDSYEDSSSVIDELYEYQDMLKEVDDIQVNPKLKKMYLVEFYKRILYNLNQDLQRWKKKPTVFDESLDTDAIDNDALDEAIDFGDPLEMERGATVPLVYDMTSDITQLVKMLDEGDDYRDYGITTLKRLVPRLMDNKQSVENFNAYWTERYPAAIDYIDKQIALIPEDVLNEIIGIKTEGISSTVNVDMDDDDNIDELTELLDFNIPVTASVQANGNTVPFMNGSAKTEDVDPDLFQLGDEDTLNESPVAVAEPEVESKKRVRSPNEEKDPWDYSSEDIWYAVYDELSASVDNEGKGQQVDKQIKAKRGERYEHVYPHGEKDIIVYAKSPEEFEFAKRVADHYGVTCEEPKRDENRNSNGFYKYSMVINMPDLF